MSTKQRLRVIHRYIARMPSLSTTVTKVLEICNDANASPGDLNRVISYDPVLTGQLLKLVNSAYYSLSCKVSSLTRAIIMLGINTVKNMVLSTSILASMKGGRSSKLVNIDAFWAHSLCVGVVAKAIAKEQHVSSIDCESYFLAGLMHDLGKIPMMVCFPELYHHAMDTSKEKSQPILEAEQHHFGLDHCQVGHLVGAKWKLGPELLPAIEKHHVIINSTGGQPCHWLCVAVANQLTNHIGVVSNSSAAVETVLFNELVERLGVSVKNLYQLEPAIHTELEKAKVFLQVIQ